MRLFTKLAQFRRHEGGATAVEFAIVSVPFFLLFMGILEYGMYQMTEVALESAVTKAGRDNAISTGSATDRVSTTETAIRSLAGGLLNSEQIYFEENTLFSPGLGPQDMCFPQGIGKPPDMTAASCTCPTCVAIEGNHQPGYQQPVGGSSSGGGNGDVIEIRAIYPWHVLFPFMKTYLGNDGVVLINSTTVIKNE